MSETAADSSDAMKPPSTWPIWLGVGCLTLATIPILLEGISAAREDHQIRAVAIGFFRDVAAGRKGAAMSRLSTEYRRALGTLDSDSGQRDWTSTDGLDIQVLSVDQRANRATVQMLLAKSGFVMKPTIRLQQDKHLAWKIVVIDGVDVDPRWTRMQAREDQAANEDLANSLANGLHLPTPTETKAP